MSVAAPPSAAGPRDVGPLVDVDSHEMIPMHMWTDSYGDAGGELAGAVGGLVTQNAENSLSRDELEHDDATITSESVWTSKGPSAPSAIDLDRRPAVLDAMGIDVQMVFPTFGLIGLLMATDPSSPSRIGLKPDVDRIGLGRRVIAAHNDWAARITREVDGTRVRPVGILVPTSADSMVHDVEALLSTGVRAVYMASGSPPAGTSPADRALDPFYATLAAARVPLVLHIGGEPALFASQQWGANCPEFDPLPHSSAEFPLQPLHASTVHFAPVNFLTAMVLGGVFERHPTLRFGIIELGAHWVGPTAERLDLWIHEFTRIKLSMKPSEYIARNVRVSPFVFEPVQMYLERFPQLADVYCYASDFPHREGGKSSAAVFDRMLDGASRHQREKFFVGNGRWLMPT